MSRNHRWSEEGLKRSAALEVVVVPCSHPSWATLNSAVGCIDAEHGPWPPALVDHHSGVRLVKGVPTRFEAVKP